MKYLMYAKEKTWVKRLHLEHLEYGEFDDEYATNDDNSDWLDCEVCEKCKYHKECLGKEFLLEVVTGKANIKRYEKYYTQEYKITKIIPFSEVFKNCKTIDDKICTILSKLKIRKSAYKRTENTFTIKFSGYQSDHLYICGIISEAFDCHVTIEDICCIDTWMCDWDSECETPNLHTSIYTFCFNSK